MLIPDIRFAFQVCTIKPEPDGDWQDRRPGGDFRPPFEWVQADLETPRQWYGWDSRFTNGNRVWELEENQVLFNRVTSIVWSPRVQNYFVTPNDCTDLESQRLMQERPEREWQPLYFHELRDVFPGLYKILHYGSEPLLPFRQPQALAGFLPRNAFREPNEDGIADVQCHLVGDLSLILALHAVCASDVDQRKDYIKQCFCWRNEPRFVPPQEDRPWNRFGR